MSALTPAALPYAPSLNPEDQTRRTIAQHRWASYQEIPPEAGVYQNARGHWVRTCWRGLGPDGIGRDAEGRVVVASQSFERRVALTVAEALANDWDKYDPDYGWVRHGWKFERDHATVAAKAGGVTVGDPGAVVWEPAPETVQASYRANPTRLAGLQDVVTAPADPSPAPAVSDAAPQRGGRRE